MLTSLLAVTTLGATALTAAAIFGQLTAALVIDRQGWLGVPQTEISASRLLGVLLLLAGVLLVTRR